MPRGNNSNLINKATEWKLQIPKEKKLTKAIWIEIFVTNICLCQRFSFLKWFQFVMKRVISFGKSIILKSRLMRSNRIYTPLFKLHVLLASEDNKSGKQKVLYFFMIQNLFSIWYAGQVNTCSNSTKNTFLEKICDSVVCVKFLTKRVFSFLKENEQKQFEHARIVCHSQCFIFGRRLFSFLRSWLLYFDYFLFYSIFFLFRLH